MTLEEQKKLAQKLKEVGYAKWTSNDLRHIDTNKIIARHSEVVEVYNIDLLEYSADAPLWIISTSIPGGMRSVKPFDIPSEKELLMHSLK